MTPGDTVQNPAATATEVRATALAAAAEACAFAMPVSLVATGSDDLGMGVVPFATAFIAVFALAAGVICRFRHNRDVRVAVVGVGIAAGLVAGRGGAGALTLVVALALGLRAVAIGLRDTRTPIAGSFALGSAAIGLEAMLAGGPQPGWAVPLAGLLPGFFLLSLWSRAVTTWSEGDAADVATADRRSWLARAGRAGIALVVAMLAVVVLGVRGGVLDRLGSWLAPVGAVLASAFAVLASIVAGPFLWLAERVHVDPEGARRVLDRLHQNADDARRTAVRHVGTASPVGRLLGLALIVAIVVLAVRMTRRARPEGTAPPRSARAPATVEIARYAETAQTPIRPSERPPAEAVRRWYGEILVAFRRAGVAKDPAATPAEFLTEAIAAVPACADDFAALTRSYEDVRYGGAQLDRAALRRLSDGRRSLHRLLRRSRSPG